MQDTDPNSEKLVLPNDEGNDACQGQITLEDFLRLRKVQTGSSDEDSSSSSESNDSDSEIDNSIDED